MPADLFAVVQFLRESPGDEALGIAYAAAYLQAAPAKAIGADAFDALGTLADQLAQRASSNRNSSRDVAFAAHLEVAAQLRRRRSAVSSAPGACSSATTARRSVACSHCRRATSRRRARRWP